MRTALVLVLVGASLGCGSGATRWIGDASRAHAEADALERSGDLERAGDLLQDLVSGPVPTGVAPQDARAVLQDTYARLANLALKRGKAADALHSADAGLQLGEAQDVFVSSLRAFRGRALEALGRDAEAAREYEAAQAIAEALLSEALADGGVR
jgi:tetratricopeptide (TPR) repeat protein